MPSYTQIAMKYVGRIIDPYLNFFSDLKRDLKRSRMKISLQEYLSVSIFTCILLFFIEIPLLMFIFFLLKFGLVFSIFMSFTASLILSILLFLVFLNYPKFVIRDRAKSIENTLPFAGVYLSTIASSGLPPHQIFEIFSKFEEYGEISKEAKNIVSDMKAFGLNINEALRRAIERTPSKDMRELLWSMLSTLESGGNLTVLLEEKSKNFLENYRRKLTEFARNLTIYLEVYLTLLVLGAIFFTILTSIMSGIGGVGQTNIVLIQFFLIFIFIPLISFGFIVLIKATSPGVE
ncbi:MAG: type II secretion system F family protein [Candidatus Aenigmatarchaeota archaeon]